MVSIEDNDEVIDAHLYPKVYPHSRIYVDSVYVD